MEIGDNIEDFAQFIQDDTNSEFFDQLGQRFSCYPMQCMLLGNKLSSDVLSKLQQTGLPIVTS